MTRTAILGIEADGRCRSLSSVGQWSAHPYRWIAIIEPSLRAAFSEAAPRLLSEMNAARSLTILVRRLPPPTAGSRADGPPSGFLCSATVFESLMRRESLSRYTELTFALLLAVMNRKIAVSRVAIRQLPLTEPRTVSPPPAISLIMAHRGRRGHLDCALRYLSKTAYPRIALRVGLDLEDTAAYRPLMRRHPSVRFARVSHAPTGPYVIRQLLAKQGREPVIAFHDSDDISCYDRFSALTAEMSATNCDLVGCHELRFHEIDREVTILRFPLDASASLRAGPEHVMLHPSSMISRKAFFDTGGFSVDRKIANDTQFLLRASFGLNIRNVDGFHYIRRKHPDALTVAPETCLEHPLRAELLRIWHRDFAEIKRGERALEESSLRPIPAARPHRLIPLTQEIARARVG